jgi:hypothetical protein
MLLQDRRFGWSEDAIKAAQDCEREDDLAILVSLVGATKEVANAPDEAGDLGMGFSGHEMVWLIVRFQKVDHAGRGMTRGTYSNHRAGGTIEGCHKRKCFRGREFGGRQEE